MFFLLPLTLGILCYYTMSMLNKKSQYNPLDNTRFVFGTSDPYQIIENHMLLKGIFHLNYKLSFLRDGSIEYYLKQKELDEYILKSTYTTNNKDTTRLKTWIFANQYVQFAKHLMWILY
jgi:hypothetical protein